MSHDELDYIQVPWFGLVWDSWERLLKIQDTLSNLPPSFSIIISRLLVFRGGRKQRVRKQGFNCHDSTVTHITPSHWINLATGQKSK